MRASLTQPLRIETTPINGRRITRIFLGERELEATPETLAAVGALATGGSVDAAFLARIGVLETESTAPFAPEQKVALAPGVALDLRYRNGKYRRASAHGSRTVQVLPETSLPISGFVPPFRLGPLQELATRLRLAWFVMLRAAVARKEVPNLEEMRARLVHLARNEVAQPPLDAILEWSEDRFVPLVPLQESEFQYGLSEITLWADRRPERALGLPHARVAVNSPIMAHQVALALGRLANGVEFGPTVALMEQAPEAVRSLWEQALRLGMIVNAPTQPSLADAVPPGSVLHLGHATLLANLDGHAVLIDPWFPPGSSLDRTPAPAIANLPPIAAIFITHHHWDHVNPETLLKLDKRLPIYVPAAESGELTVRTAAFLATLGFTKVFPLAHGESVAFGNGSVTAAPFFGEDPERIGWNGNTYILTDHGKSALVHVDSATDANGTSWRNSETAAAIRERFGTLSPVFATRRQERSTQIEFGWEFLLRPTEEWVLPAENADNNASFLAGLVTATGGGSLVLYSEGGAEWYPEGTDFLRTGADTGLDACRQWGWDDLAAIQAAVQERGSSCTVSHPYDRFRIGGAFETKIRAKS